MLRQFDNHKIGQLYHVIVGYTIYLFFIVCHSAMLYLCLFVVKNCGRSNGSHLYQHNVIIVDTIVPPNIGIVIMLICIFSKLTYRINSTLYSNILLQFFKGMNLRAVCLNDNRKNAMLHCCNFFWLILKLGYTTSLYQHRMLIDKSVMHIQ